MTPLNFILLAFAVFYFAVAIVNTHGAFGMFDWARKHIPHGGLLACIVCVSIWLALLGYWLLTTGAAFVVYAGAAAGVAVLIAYWQGLIAG